MTSKERAVCNYFAQCVIDAQWEGEFEPWPANGGPGCTISHATCVWCSALQPDGHRDTCPVVRAQNFLAGGVDKFFGLTG